MITAAMALVLAASGSQDPQARAEELVRQLGAESVQEREQAEEGLRRLGEAAIPALERAARDEDPERAARAQGLLAELRARDRGRSQRQESPGREQGMGHGRLQAQFQFVVETPTYRAEVNDGGVRLTLKETGETLEADSIEEFRERYPEYADYIPNLEGRGRFPDGSGEFWFEWRQDFAPDFEMRPIPWSDLPEWMRERLEQLRRELEEMPRGFDLPEWSFEMPDFDRPWWRHLFPDPVEPAPRRSSERRRDLGARFADLDSQERCELGLNPAEGVRVAEVEDGGAAADADLRAGDVILAVNGQQVASRWELRRRLARAMDQEGRATLEVLREGERIEIVLWNAAVRRDF